MIKKSFEKKKAIELRKQGKTYAEILSVIPVAKSTLALWLHDVRLAKYQYQTLTEKKILSQKRGAAAKKKQRIEKKGQILIDSKSDIGKLSKRELFLIGVCLYWAEGTKEKDYYPGSRIVFSNMDPSMIRIFLIWLSRVAKVPKNMVGFQIFLHENHTVRLSEVIQYWQSVTGYPSKHFKKVYLKKNKKVSTKRHNTEERYYGLLRIVVSKSSTLVRQIAGWTEGIIENV